MPGVTVIIGYGQALCEGVNPSFLTSLAEVRG